METRRYAYDRPAVATSTAADRMTFIKKTYAHLGAAILAFVGVEALLLTTDFGKSVAMQLLRMRHGWLAILLVFMAVGTLAQWWARSNSSRFVQYLGLGLYVVAEAFIFLPMMYIAAYYSSPDVIPTAGLITGIVFGGLTLVVMLSGKDFSWLRGLLTAASLGALGVIIASLLFGFQLGIVFSGFMVVLAAGYVLYHTSRVLRDYPIGYEVFAALTLFASIALLFWYVLRILLDRR
jgi:FtsH-binding integral membrane protein